MARLNSNWRFLDTGINNPYMNMAIDEGIVQAFSKKELPILRFYDWSEPAISIGYSQRAGEVLEVDLCKKEGIPIIRRPTGGGVVFHGIDITYSVILPKTFTANIQDTFLWIQSNIKKGLEALGINVNLYNIKESSPLRYCFTSPNISDLMAGGRKLAGLAGRRIKGKILCQGYIYYRDAFGMVKFVKGLNELNKKAVNIQTLLDIDQDTIKKHIAQNWPQALIGDRLNNKEEKLIADLYEEKYSQDEWNYRR